MLAIKFKRIGKKHQPSFRIIVTEKRHTVFGRFVEDLGWMDPKAKEAKINKERALHWVKVGAQPTASIHNLFVREGILEGKKIPVHKKPKKSSSAEASADAKALAGKPEGKETGSASAATAAPA